MIPQAKLDELKALWEESSAARMPESGLHVYAEERPQPGICYGDGDAVTSEVWGNMAYGVPALGQAKYMVEAFNNCKDLVDEIERLKQPLADDAQHVIGNAVFAAETNVDTLSRKVLKDNLPNGTQALYYAILADVLTSLDKIKAYLKSHE